MQPRVIDQSNWEVVDNIYFTLCYPSNWELDTSGTFGSILFLYAPVMGSYDEARPNINLMVDVCQYGESLERYVEISKVSLMRTITDCIIVAADYKESINGSCIALEAIGRQGIYDLKWIQYYWVYNNVAFILTYVSSSHYRDEDNVALQILNSFKLNFETIESLT